MEKTAAMATMLLSGLVILLLSLFWVPHPAAVVAVEQYGRD